MPWTTLEHGAAARRGVATTAFETVLRLAALVAPWAPPRLRRRIARLDFDAAPARAEILEDLREPAVAAARSLARRHGAAFGVSPARWAAFALPPCTEPYLTLPRLVLHRPGRVWGGAATLVLDCREEVELRWPGPSRTPVLVIAGNLELRRVCVVAPAVLNLEPERLLRLHAGALVWFRREPLAQLFHAARDAGLDPAALIGAAWPAGAGEEVGTAVGTLWLHRDQGEARLGNRRVRCSGREMAALRLLAAQPGRPVARAVLRRALDAASDRAVAMLILRLRDKFGNGLITSLYGAGYVLETPEA